MKEILETIPRIELALIIIGVFALMLGIIFVYAMIHEYRMYLEEHRKARISFRDFFKQEQFYTIPMARVCQLMRLMWLPITQLVVLQKRADWVISELSLLVSVLVKVHKY